MTLSSHCLPGGVLHYYVLILYNNDMWRTCIHSTMYLCVYIIGYNSHRAYTHSHPHIVTMRRGLHVDSLPNRTLLFCVDCVDCGDGVLCILYAMLVDEMTACPALHCTALVFTCTDIVTSYTDKVWCLTCCYFNTVLQIHELAEI